MIEEIMLGGKPFVFRYRPDNEFTLDEIKDSYIYFQKRELLNDPLDSTPDLIDFKEVNFEKLLIVFEELIGKKNTNFVTEKLSKKQIEELVNRSIPDFINKHGIACFSMLPGVNMPLLANYANNHKGIYIQYNIDYDSKFFNGLKLINYQKELSKIKVELMENENDIFDIFYLKHDSWSYEKELRLVKENFGKYYLNRKAMRNIICGFNCSDDYIEKIIEANQSNDHVNIWKMEKPNALNKLTLIQIE